MVDAVQRQRPGALLHQAGVQRRWARPRRARRSSLEELRATSQQIVDSGAATYGIAFDTGADSGGGWFIEQWFAKLGELYADNENGRAAPATRVLYDGPVGVELMTGVQSHGHRRPRRQRRRQRLGGQDTFLKLADPQSPGGDDDRDLGCTRHGAERARTAG